MRGMEWVAFFSIVTDAAAEVPRKVVTVHVTWHTPCAYDDVTYAYDGVTYRGSQEGRDRACDLARAMCI